MHVYETLSGPCRVAICRRLAVGLLLVVATGIARAADFVEAFEPTFPDVVDQLRALGVDVAD